MPKENLSELQAFIAVARERSFTRAAAQLGLSRSALSHAMLALEARLGVRLLTRTTRSVSTTEAGTRLLNAVAPRLDEIELELGSLSAMRDKPAGMVRITAHDHAVVTALWPRLLPLMQAHPDVRIDFSVDYGLTDIAAHRFDAGVRLGDQVDKDMIAVRIAPDLRMAVVGAPAYLAAQPLPATPHDLTSHRCINLRLPTHGGLYAWEFEKDGQKINVRVEGQTVFNNTFLMLQAALDGMGLAYVPLDVAQPHIDKGRLEPVLKDWWPLFSGYHLYYASRRQPPPALALVIDALRWREKTPSVAKARKGRGS
ncbi:MAG: Transcriptional regulator, LysR family [uncultured Paraburkholderia sp.]|uniref:LysR family transcriptional regulator n=1 Tax=uncultured Paraburkholderia sp. TaxID=1822466 RepID=UPI00259793E1|nr:LysR family transcriptional regulator [uncultured Paraburkholderia sp.]CAH2903896.1 MAG: Transcriptional regulator, LysR family [uncultured Paraburkholderia sp.]CAH2941906.1 MAG: Transcriptional regulator, LysR family [uncultured Paraburkholderia sp.]